MTDSEHNTALILFENRIKIISTSRAGKYLKQTEASCFLDNKLHVLYDKFTLLRTRIRYSGGRDSSRSDFIVIVTLLMNMIFLFRLQGFYFQAIS